MGRTIYSTLIVDVHGTSEIIVQPLGGPDGSVWVVRDIRGFCSNALGAATFQAYDSAGATFAFDSVELGSAGVPFSWTGRQVFYPGDTISLTGNAVSVLTPVFDWRVSGYQLLP